MKKPPKPVPTKAEARTALIEAIAALLEAMAQIGRRAQRPRWAWRKP